MLSCFLITAVNVRLHTLLATVRYHIPEMRTLMRGSCWVELYRPEFGYFVALFHFCKNDNTAHLHSLGRIKKTCEPASLTQPEQFTCCNKAINYIFFYFLFDRNWSDHVKDTDLQWKREKPFGFQIFLCGWFCPVLFVYI